MMDNIFSGLTTEEYALLKESIPLVSILIARADGEIDKDEMEWATKITNIRTYSSPEMLKEFYQEVGQDFVDKLVEVKSNYPSNEEISERLGLLNPVLAKLDQHVGATLYKDLKTFAEHVAKASGGFLRMWSISKEEAKWAKLPSVDPIDFPEPEEEA